MSAQDRIPVVVLAGFLGSGKTTLLNSLINQADGQRIVALVNDFGALNVDADLVVGVEGSTVSFANGCVCCTIHDDLANECLNILQNQERPDLVLVELSGVSEPEPVMNTFLETDLKPFFELSAVLTVVDAAGWTGLEPEAVELAHRQVRDADLLVLSKTDLASTNAVSRIKGSIEGLNHSSQIIEATKGKLPLGLLLDRSFDHAASIPGERTPHGLASVQWTSGNAPVSLPALEGFLNALPSGLVRVKGFLWLEELPNLKFLLQAVGSRYDITCLGNWGEHEPCSQLVMIGLSRSIDSVELSAKLDACQGTGDDSASPILRLIKRIAPEYLERPAA